MVMFKIRCYLRKGEEEEEGERSEEGEKQKEKERKKKKVVHSTSWPIIPRLLTHWTLLLQRLLN